VSSVPSENASCPDVSSPLEKRSMSQIVLSGETNGLAKEYQVGDIKE
jgi:hypothetical protein